MPKEIIRFKCNYCKKHYSTKSDAAKHENKCFYNPVNKSCISCGNHYSNGFGAFCQISEKKIFVPGDPIRDCPDWKEIECDEDSGYFED
jgi:hypothetical protein